MPVFSAILGAAVSYYGASQNSSAQGRANRTNIALQRENQAWQEQMSNTAVQRRKADIIAAGGNPALAFTNGQEASTPVTTPAKVESTRPGDATIAGFNTAMQMATVQQTKAQTALTLATARKASVEADNMEKFGSKEAEFAFNVKLEASEQADLKTEITRLERDLTAVQVEKLEKALPLMLKELDAKARSEDLNADALENIARIYGIEGGKFAPLLGLLLRIFGK